MDEAKLMVKMLEEEVQRMRLSTESKKVLAAAEREAKLIKKCQQTSELCNKKSAELEATRRKLEEVEKTEAMAQRKLTTLSRLQSAAETSTEQLALRLSELETYSNDKNGLIRLLKGQLPPETLADMDISLPLEMSRLFHNLLHQEEKLRVEDEAANRKVVELKLKTHGENELNRRVEWWLVDFQDKCSEYRAALTENIRRIRVDHFITKAELVSQPDYPVLSEVITSELDRARRVYNAELDVECSICLVAEERDWWWCSGCLKKCHQDCIENVWVASDVQRCPHCQRLVN